MVLSIVLQESAQPSAPAVPMTSMLMAASADPHCPLLLLGKDTTRAVSAPSLRTVLLYFEIAK